jgi:hypothetical protein
MEINRSSLNNSSRKLRSLASSVINAYYLEQENLLNMFVDFIDSTPVYAQYLESIHAEIPELEKDVKEVVGSYGMAILETGKTPEEQTNYIYQLLKYCLANKIPVHKIGWSYTGSTKYQDMAKEFGNRIIHPFVVNLENYLLDIYNDIGYGYEDRFGISINGTGVQVNVATDNSIINASQVNNGTEEICNRLEELKEALSSLSQEIPDKDLVISNIDFLQSELKLQNPRREAITTLWSNILKLMGTIAALEGTVSGIERLMSAI